MEEIVLAHKELFLIVCGTVMGTVSRIVTLKTDARQYPSYPNGALINLVTGFIAAAIGAVAIPALLAGNYVAVTFLGIAIQHFRDIRKMERDSLASLEGTEFTRRGDAYIDGISKTYEARNYICLVTAFSVVLITGQLYRDQALFNIAVSAVIGLTVTFACARFTKGHQIGDICEVAQGKIEVNGSELQVDGIFVTNELGTEASRTLFRQEGVAFVLTPKRQSYRVTVENFGQRQAILYEAVRSYGVKRYCFTRRSFADGRVVIAFVPIQHDIEGIQRTITTTPILESSKKVTI